MSHQFYGTDGPHSLAHAARAKRDEYLAYLIQAGYRYLVTRLFGTRDRAQRASESLQACYVRDRGLTTMPAPDSLSARNCNDEQDRTHTAA
ncbi:hypothetical protein [Roseospira navarrensis]|uniref:Uncharacterized protein n=1 Tax=Roseospira navarrensis TaxID=140058 RepID=A0A7X2D4I8_9PROT|nr:hypothetical protein [Roseospira navarrensis]MQX37988.1 hypothetical protein [Roseospira navarrensis]